MEKNLEAMTTDDMLFVLLAKSWDESQTDNKSANTCLNELVETFAEKDINIDVFEVLHLIAFIWCVEEREGLLISPKNILKSDIHDFMGKYISTHWTNITDTLLKGIGNIKDQIQINMTELFDGVKIYLVWYRLVHDQLAKVNTGLESSERKGLEKEIAALSKAFLDQWFSPSLSGVWAPKVWLGSYEYAKELHTYKKVVRLTKAGFMDETKRSVRKLIDILIKKNQIWAKRKKS